MVTVFPGIYVSWTLTGYMVEFEKRIYKLALQPILFGLIDLIFRDTYVSSTLTGNIVEFVQKKYKLALQFLHSSVEFFREKSLKVQNNQLFSQ